MELGLYTFAELAPDPATGRAIAPAQRLRDLIEEIELADQVGLDVFGVGEHHRPDFAVSAPAVVLAAAAARTKRIRLTSAVTVLSSDDPVRVFQEFATLDLLSGGRAEIMVGRGSFIESFPLFGYDLDDYDELFAEKLDLLLRLRDEERVTWSGRHRAAARRPGRLPAARAGAAAGLDRRRRHARVGGPRRDARPADGARDHRRACRSASRRSPSSTAARPREAGHDPLPRSASTRTASSPTRRSRRSTSRSRTSRAMMNRIGRERGWPPMTRADYDASAHAPRRELRRQPAAGGREDPLPARDLRPRPLPGAVHRRHPAHAKMMRSIELSGPRSRPSSGPRSARRASITLRV